MLPYGTFPTTAVRDGGPVTTVGLAGDGPATDAVRAALEDTGAGVVAVDAADAADIRTVDVAVVSGPVGDDRFERAATVGRETSTPLVCIEAGGVGGRPVAGVEAAVSGSAPGTACYDCLRTRVAAAEPETDAGDVDRATVRFAGAVAGRELTRLVAGGESQLLGGVIEVPHAARQLLPVPGCACGSPAERRLEVAHVDRTLDESLSLAEGAFDERVGPITAVGESESFPVPYYLATLASTPFSDADAPDHAAGVGLSWDPAFMKALGEGLERYSAAVYSTDRLLVDPDRRVPADAFVAPDDPVEVAYWYPAEHLDTGERKAVPAELVVFPPPERRIRPAITTGLGLGNRTIEALCSGLYEVIERDAAMLSWYSSDEPMALAVDDGGYRTLSSRAESEGLAATTLLLTQDVDVPVVAACVHREGDWPRFAAGSASDLDPAAAARGALEEALQNWLELRRMGQSQAESESGAIGEYAAFPEAARELVDVETTIPAESVGPETPPDGRAELDALVDRATAAGLEPYGARLTPRDVERLGFEAVRVVVPSAQPLFTGEAYFGDRARTVPKSLGFEPRLERAYHPYP